MANQVTVDNTAGTRYAQAVTNWLSRAAKLDAAEFSVDVGQNFKLARQSGSPNNLGLLQATQFTSIVWQETISVSQYSPNFTLSMSDGSQNAVPVLYTFPNAPLHMTTDWGRSKGFPLTIKKTAKESELDCRPSACKQNSNLPECTGVSPFWTTCDTRCASMNGIWDLNTKTCALTYALIEICFAAASKTGSSGLVLNTIDEKGGSLAESLSPGSAGCFYDNGIEKSFNLYPAFYSPYGGQDRIKIKVMSAEDPLLVAKKKRSRNPDLC